MRRSLVKTIAMVAGTGLFVLGACYIAYSYSTGITGQTKKNSQTAGCGAKIAGGGSCHGTSANSAIQVTLSGPAVLPVGTPGLYTISLTGSSSSGGGCDIAVSSGTLSPDSTLLQLLNQELTHVSALTTPYAIRFTYTSNSPGTATMYANGKASSGWNWAPSLAIRVGPPPAPALVLPADGSSAIPTGAVLRWSGVQGPRWTIEISPDQNFTVLLGPVPGYSTSDTMFTIPEGVLSNNAQYYWRVNGADTGGVSGWSPVWSFSTALTGVGEQNNQAPSEYALDQNYPNPFNPTTGVRFQVPGVSDVKITVYDVLGREVATLVNERKVPGTYTVTFDGSGLASGVYLYRLQAKSATSNFTDVKKLLLLK